MTPDRILSPHFSLYELTKTSHADLQMENRHVTDEELGKLQLLAYLLEEVQVILGYNVEIHSGRRFLELNKRVGGSERSQHMRCEAVDFSKVGPDTYESVEATFNKLVEAGRKGLVRFGQIILETDGNTREGRRFWVHISLGEPYRDAARCGEVFTAIDKKMTFVERIA